MEATLNLWLTILACGIATYVVRLSFIAVHGRITVPGWFARALTFVPVAVLSAITLPDILFQNDALNFSPLNARIWAGILAALVAWRTKNIWVTIVVGMGALWGILYFVR